MSTDPNVWECATCGAVWDAGEDTAPVVCPRCGSTEVFKDPNKPGGQKPINWPGSW